MSFKIIGGVLQNYFPEEDEHDVVIPDGVTVISSRAFSSCAALKNVKLPSSLERIGDFAFIASGLEYVELPAGVTHIGSGAFRDCTSLETVYFPLSLSDIGFGAFDGTEWLEKYRDDFVIVNGMLLRYRGKSESVCVPGCVTKICSGAFMECGEVRNITIPKSVSVIGERCFAMCTSLEQVHFHDGIKRIGAFAFENCSKLLDAVIPEGVTEIGSGFFAFCKSLTGVTLPKKLDTMGDRLFYGCTSLRKITVPNGVSVIRELSFMSCRCLECAVIPDSVISIEHEAFSSCASLETVTMPRGIKEIHETAFYCTNGIKTIYFGEYTIRSTAFDMRCFRPDRIREMIDSKKYTMSFDRSVKYSIVIDAFLNYSQIEAENYIKKNYLKVMRHLIDVNDYECFKRLISCGRFAGKRSTEKLFEYAAAHTESCGDPQIQVFISNYRSEMYPDDDLFGTLKL